MIEKIAKLFPWVQGLLCSVVFCSFLMSLFSAFGVNIGFFNAFTLLSIIYISGVAIGIGIRSGVKSTLENVTLKMNIHIFNEKEK